MKSKLEEKFEAFELEMEVALDALIRFVKSLNNEAYLPLDFTWESLDRLEIVYKEILQGRMSANVEEDIFNTSVARYMGETLRKNLGGSWELELDKELFNYGLPGIAQIDGLAPD